MTDRPHKLGIVPVGKDRRLDVDTGWGKFSILIAADGTLLHLSPPEFREPSGNPGRLPQATTIAQKARGAVGLVKAEMGIRAATDDTVAARKAICEQCEHNDIGKCNGGCGCYLWAKIRVADEKCPKGKW